MRFQGDVLSQQGYTATKDIRRPPKLEIVVSRITKTISD